MSESTPQVHATASAAARADPTTVHLGGETNNEPDPAEYNQFIDQVELESVEVVDLAATRHGPGQPDSVGFEVEGGHQTVEGALFVRFELRVKAVRDDSEDAGEKPVADLRVAIVMRFSIGDTPPSELVRARFLQTTAAMVAQPYLREHLSALTARLGLEGVTLPLARLHPPAATE